MNTSDYGDVDMTAYRRQHGISDQVAMTGDDWMSERDHKSQKRADANVKKTAVAAAKKLEAAADAVNELLRACLDAGHEDKQGAGDGRRTLIASMMEYSAWLDSVYGRSV